MAIEFRGILAACVTPFTADGSEVDFEGIDAQVEHLVSNGVNGLVPGGSTGEFFVLSVAERKASNRAYVDAAAGRVPVIAGTGALSTAETIELSRDAEDAGADALIIVPPFYCTPSFDEVLAHYQAISKAVDIPIMFYNNPAATGLELTPEQLGRLGAETGVWCYKDTGGDFPKFTEVHYGRADDIAALNGCDTLTFAALALGAKACVWGAASIMPALCTDLYQALAVDEDLPKARELWATINPICVFLESHNYAGAVKAGLELIGVPAGPARAPVQPLADKDREELRRLLEAAGVTTATR